MDNESSTKDPDSQHAASSYERGNGRPIPIPKIFVVCDQRDTAPVWGYILRQQGPIVTLETSVEKSLDQLSRCQSST